MARALVVTLLSVGVGVLIGVGAAAGFAALRGGQFSDEFGSSLWVVGALMLLLTVCSFSPSMRDAHGEVRSADRSGAGLTVVSALSAFGLFGIALLVT